MRSLVLMPLLLAVPASAHAQWTPYPHVLQFRVEGKGAWSVSCQLLDKHREAVSYELTGRGQDRFNKEVTGGQCSYQAAPDERLKIVITGNYVCPLPAPEKRRCEQTFPAGSTGQLEIRRWSQPS